MEGDVLHSLANVCFSISLWFYYFFFIALTLSLLVRLNATGLAFVFFFPCLYFICISASFLSPVYHHHYVFSIISSFSFSLCFASSCYYHFFSFYSPHAFMILILFLIFLRYHHLPPSSMSHLKNSHLLYFNVKSPSLVKTDSRSGNSLVHSYMILETTTLPTPWTERTVIPPPKTPCQVPAYLSHLLFL